MPMKAVMPGAANVPTGDALEIPLHDPERLVILQYTSGSTSEPKGVMIPDRVLSANIDACAEAAELSRDDAMVSWLPLYHDMGLVGFLALPMTKGVDLVQAAPQDFLAHPGNWMQWLSDYRATATAGPNFSWVLATRALKRMKDLDLSRLTVALSGAEPVDPKAVEAFVAEASRFGFTPGGMFPAFGMAEVAIGGTFPPRRRGLVTDTVDRIVLETQRVAKPVEIDDQDELGLTARQLPLLGKPVPGLEMRVVDPETFEELPERHVGELLLRGTSVTPGYYKRPDATAALFRDGWLCTGDLAYLLDGELVLCGRIKDVIIVGGRNVFPEDIERAVGPLDGVRAGNVIAFGMEGYKGKESVVVVAEVRVSDTSGEPRRHPRPDPPPHARGVRAAAARRHARHARHPAQDVERQAPARQVPRRVPERGTGPPYLISGARAWPRSSTRPSTWPLAGMLTVNPSTPGWSWAANCSATLSGSPQMKLPSHTACSSSDIDARSRPRRWKYATRSDIASFVVGAMQAVFCHDTVISSRLRPSRSQCSASASSLR